MSSQISVEDKAKINEENIRIREEFEKIRFWPRRLRCDGWVKFLFPVLWAVNLLLNLVGLGQIYLTAYLNNLLLLGDIMILSTFFIASYVTNQIWEGMRDQLQKQIRKLLVDDTEQPRNYYRFHKFRDLVYFKLRSTSELVIPLVIGLTFCIGFGTHTLSFDYSYWEGPGWGAIHVEGFQMVLRFCALITQAILWGWWLLFLGSLFFSIYLEFWLVNRLGYTSKKDKKAEIFEDLDTKETPQSAETKEISQKGEKKKATKDYEKELYRMSFPLKIDYIDLQMGSFDALGKFVLATILPGIFLATIMGIYGVPAIWINNDLAWGYGFISMGIVIVIVLTTLLYKNTTNLHKAIVESKAVFREKAFDDIQYLWSHPKEGEKINYEEIKNIYDFVVTIDVISDWPFNPTSLKKLAVTLLTAVVPLILSFFGLNITL